MSEKIILNKSVYIKKLKKLINQSDIRLIKDKINHITHSINNNDHVSNGIDNSGEHPDTINISKNYILNELTQIEKTRTIERTKYYIQRLIKSISEIKTNKVNDINLNRWKEYDNIITDSLWLLPKRDSYGVHASWYWGNFIPQIPHQLMLRYTKSGDLVVDPFIGSGTTLLECLRLKRNGIGVELNKEIAKKTKQILKKGEQYITEDELSDTNSAIDYTVKTIVEIGDSTELDFKKLLRKHGFTSAQFLLLHPPYHDIIKFSDHPNDLSAQKEIEGFIAMFCKVIDNISPILDKGRYMAIVIGDKYSNGEWIPLGFYVMNELLKRSFKLKSIVVKNFEDTLAKRNQKELWRYRALTGGFYIFKHEYILLFKKK